MIKLKRKATALALMSVLAISQAQSASAGTFGASVETYYGTLTPCTLSVVGSLPVKVDSPSHIFAHAVTTYFGQHNPNTAGGYYYLSLRPTNGDPPVAFNNTFLTNFIAPADTTVTLVSSGVLQEIGSAAPAKVLPGDYILEFIVTADTKSCDVSNPLPYVYPGNLTYMILSAALDQIFTSGFNAMVFGENRMKKMV